MISRQLRILIVEDSDDDAALMVRTLKREGYDPVYERVDRAEAMASALARQAWDVILSDYAMPHFSGPVALEMVKSRGLDIPFLIVSGAIGEEVAVSLMKSGAHDYINKGNLARLSAAIEREMGDAVERRERRRADEQLRQYEAQLRSLAAELSLAEERQRRLLATELHEGIGQILVLALIKVGELQSHAQNLQAESLKEIHGLIGRAIKDTRAVTARLSPPILYDLGLEAALKWLTEQVERENEIPVTFTHAGETSPIDSDLTVVLFQAVRELLKNAVTHARARTLTVSLHIGPETAEVSVEDDGIGMDPPGIHSQSPRNGTYGLFSIQERMKYLGGSVKIESEKGKGTRITMRAPVRPAGTIENRKQLPLDFRKDDKSE